MTFYKFRSILVEIEIHNFKGEAMKKKGWLIGITAIFILIIYFLMSQEQDGINRMEKLISEEIKSNGSITIYNDTHIDDYRLVSYIKGNKTKYDKIGYAHLIIDSKGKYELLNIIQADKITEQANNIKLYEFYNLEEKFLKFATDKVASDVTIGRSLFIVSNNNKLSRIDRIMDRGEIQVIDINTSPSINFFDDLNSVNKVKYEFYNENGDIIK